MESRKVANLNQNAESGHPQFSLFAELCSSQSTDVFIKHSVSCTLFFNMYPCYKGSSLLKYKNQTITEEKYA